MKRVFKQIFSDLQVAVTVKHIMTTKLICCGPNDDVKQVLDGQPELDQIPVKASGNIVGVLERQDPGTRSVREAMVQLSDALLLSEQTSIQDCIALLHAGPKYRLVASASGGIGGIVTPSDLDKLPVRLLLFTQIAHLERLMTQRIINYFNGDESKIEAALDDADHAAMQGIRRYQDSLAKKNLTIDALEATMFSHKAKLVVKFDDTPEEIRLAQEPLVKLRNAVCHARSYESAKSFERLYLVVCNLAEWIGFFEKPRRRAK